MVSAPTQFETRLDAVLRRRIDGYLELIACERLSGGANQQTFRIVFRHTDHAEQQLALRLTADPTGTDPQSVNVGSDTEASLFQAAATAGIPSPEIHYVLTPADEIGAGFIMAWLEGETLGYRIVRSQKFAHIRPQLAAQCGIILARIHAIDVHASTIATRLKATTPGEYVQTTWDRYQILQTPHPMIDYTARWLLEHLPQNPRTTLVHNDFRNGNLIIDESGIVGVLDWEIAHVGDPLRDLGWLCTNSWRFGQTELPVGGFGHYDDLVSAYETESGYKIDREHLHFWEVFGSFWWAIGCLLMAEHYRSGPDPSVERPAIGRRSSECQVDCVNLLIPGPVNLVAAERAPNNELPRTDELLESVANFLRNDIGPVANNRNAFLAKVAANSLEIVNRELRLGGAQTVQEHSSLRALLECDGSVDSLRWRLVEQLRSGTLALDDERLIAHLRDTTVNRLAIDQPNYSGFDTAIKFPC